MKLHTLLTSLLFPGQLVLAEEPAQPKLAPRPIPGMEAVVTALTAPAALEAKETHEAVTNPPVPGWETVEKKPVSANRDQARVLYIHRRATLPAALVKDLPVPQPIQVSRQQVQVRLGAVKIIPKSQAAALVTAKQ